MALASHKRPNKAGRGGRWKLRLYVADGTPRAILAMENLTRLCEEHLPGAYRIEVIDVLREPLKASAEQIVAVPTLVRTAPAPRRTLIGDLSDTRRVLLGLDLPPAASG